MEVRKLLEKCPHCGKKPPFERVKGYWEEYCDGRIILEDAYKCSCGKIYMEKKECLGCREMTPKELEDYVPVCEGGR